MTVVTHRRAWALVLVLVLVTAGCGGGADPDADGEAVATAAGESLIIYSGRNESLIGPLLARFEAASGVDVEVRYGSTTELTATLLEEGERLLVDRRAGSEDVAVVDRDVDVVGAEQLGGP